jgi:hypothetical protein
MSWLIPRNLRSRFLRAMTPLGGAGGVLLAARYVSYQAKTSVQEIRSRKIRFQKDLPQEVIAFNGSEELHSWKRAATHLRCQVVPSM